MQGAASGKGQMWGRGEREVLRMSGLFSLQERGKWGLGFWG